MVRKTCTSFLFVSLLASPAFAACAADEAALFSCLVDDQKHMVQLCAVRDDAAGGYQSLQYHYGTAETDELVFPPDRREGRKQLSFAHAIDKTVYNWSLRFDHKGFIYRVFGMGEKAGVEVWINKKRIAQALCRERPVAYPSDIRRASGCDMRNPFGAAGCSETAPEKK